MEKISVASLNPADFEGFMTKCGGGTKTWHKRWFVLKGNKLYYFKGKKDTEITGMVVLTPDSFVRKEPSYKKKSKNTFAVGTTTRIFYMFPESQLETDQWVAVITKNIDNLKKPKETIKPVVTTTTTTSPVSSSNVSNNTSSSYNTPVNNTVDDDVNEVVRDFNPDKDGVRAGLEAARDLIPYLQPGQEGTEEGRIYEFWEIWSESIPSKSELEEGSIIFEVSASADLEKLSWRSSGPQHIFIQKMVDFFWNVGAPETEIDRLNDVGSDINPPVIGSWIDMSGKGGMDGGWFFPVETTLELAIKSSDEGPACAQFDQWASSKGIELIASVGRDMGAAPPRQTEIKFAIPGNTYEEQLSIALTAYPALSVPDIPQDALRIIKGQCGLGLVMSVVTSSEGMVRLGLLFPNPTKQAVQSLCSLNGAAFNILNNFESALQVTSPTYVEFQFLMRGYGYGVYKEGFDIVFHYTAGVESVG